MYFLGPLFFNFYVKNLAKTEYKDCTVVQYADDTFLFTFDTDEILLKTKLEHNISKINFFLQSPSGWWTNKKQNILCLASGRG